MMSLTTSRGRATVGQLCEAFGISRQAYYAARQAPRSPGAQEPERIRRPERRGPWVSDATLIEKIQQVVAEFPAWGVRKVWAYLKRVGIVVSRKRVWKRMKALGLTLPPLCERAEPLRRGHVAVPESNRRWATDLTTTWTAQEGTVALVPVIDCGDRVVFGIEVTKSQESPAVLAPVEQSLEEAFASPASVPEGLELRSDHGPQYTGSDCEELCETWRLEHTLAPVGRPTGNAVAERFIQTLKVELIWTRPGDGPPHPVAPHAVHELRVPEGRGHEARSVEARVGGQTPKLVEQGLDAIPVDLHTEHPVRRGAHTAPPPGTP